LGYIAFFELSDMVYGMQIFEITRPESDIILLNAEILKMMKKVLLGKKRISQ
jgi:hypothetical protein